MGSLAAAKREAAEKAAEKKRREEERAAALARISGLSEAEAPGQAPAPASFLPPVKDALPAEATRRSRRSTPRPRRREWCLLLNVASVGVGEVVESLGVTMAAAIDRAKAYVDAGADHHLKRRRRSPNETPFRKRDRRALAAT